MRASLCCVAALIGMGMAAGETPAAENNSGREGAGRDRYTQTLIEGEELMFTMDVPYVLPSQETPIVLAQADAGSTPQPDFILNACSEKPSTGNPRSAMRVVDPAGMLMIYIQGRDNRVVDLADIKNVMMLQGTRHGTLFSEVDSEGFTSYHYDAEPNYEGNDKAVFMAEYQGKRYKIVVELHVFEVIDESASTCPPSKLIKVTEPSSGASGYGASYDLPSDSVI